MADLNYPELIDEQDKELQELDARIALDSELLYLADYVMTSRPDIEGKVHPIPGVINATLNKPAVFGANVVSALGAVKQQVMVSCDDESFDTHYVERFLEAAFLSANDRLRKRGQPLLNPFADVQLCFRGRTGRRVLFREQDGVLVPDISLWDGRYIRYQMGNDGLDWAALQMTRTKREIEAEYGIAIQGKEGKVLDVWDREHNEVWIDTTRVSVDLDGKARKEEHDYGYVPVVFQIVPLGYGNMLWDEHRLKNEGESIFFLIRGIVPQLNMLMSILSSLNFLSVKRPTQFASSGGTTAESPEYDEAMAPGAITSVEIGGGIKPIDFGDALRAAEIAYNMLEKAIQEGSYTDIDIGNVRQPFSAVALITVGESRDQVYLPRLASKEQLNIDTAEMIIRQVEQIGGTVELGMLGHKEKFSTSKLKGEYTVDYKYFVKDPKRDIARMAVAQQAKEWYPRKHIYTEVLQVEDPDGMEQEWYSELAEKVDPNILKHRIIMGLLKKVEDGDEDAAMEAKIMAAGMGMTIAQMKAGIMPEVPQIEAPVEPVVPLLPEGGRTGGLIPSSAKKAGELTRQPAEVKEEE